MKDSVMFFQIENGILVVLTYAGRLFQRSMNASGQWMEIPLPVFPTEKKEVDEKEVSWQTTKSQNS